MHMPERPIIAVALSVVVHVALVGGAALMPVRLASGHGGRPGDLPSDDGAEDRDGVTQLFESGLHGNTVDVDRDVDGELGGGARQAESERASSDSAHADQEPEHDRVTASSQVDEPAPRKARRARKERRRRAKAGNPEPRRPKPRAGTNAGREHGGEGDTPGPGVRHGSREAKPGELHVAGSLTHAIPMAWGENPLWHALDLGVVAEAPVTIAVKDGKIAKVSYPDEDTPALIRRIVDGALVMLRARKVSLSLSADATGQERLLVTVTISERELTAGEKAVAAEKPVLQMSDVPPTADAPGNGNFTFASGRHVEVKIALLR